MKYFQKFKVFQYPRRISHRNILYAFLGLLFGYVSPASAEIQFVPNTAGMEVLRANIVKLGKLQVAGLQSSSIELSNCREKSGTLMGREPNRLYMNYKLSMVCNISRSGISGNEYKDATAHIELESGGPASSTGKYRYREKLTLTVDGIVPSHPDRFSGEPIRYLMQTSLCKQSVQPMEVDTVTAACKPELYAIKGFSDEARKKLRWSLAPTAVPPAVRQQYEQLRARKLEMISGSQDVTKELAEKERRKKILQSPATATAVKRMGIIKVESIKEGQVFTSPDKPIEIELSPNANLWVDDGSCCWLEFAYEPTIGIFPASYDPAQGIKIWLDPLRFGVGNIGYGSKYSFIITPKRLAQLAADSANKMGLAKVYADSISKYHGAGQWKLRAVRMNKDGTPADAPFQSPQNKNAEWRLFELTSVEAKKVAQDRLTRQKLGVRAYIGSKESSGTAVANAKDVATRSNPSRTGVTVDPPQEGPPATQSGVTVNPPKEGPPSVQTRNQGSGAGAAQAQVSPNTLERSAKAMRPKLEIKSLGVSPSRLVEGSSFALVIAIQNSGGVSSTSEQRIIVSCRALSGGGCPVGNGEYPVRKAIGPGQSFELKLSSVPAVQAGEYQVTARVKGDSDASAKKITLDIGKFAPEPKRAVPTMPSRPSR